MRILPFRLQHPGRESTSSAFPGLDIAARSLALVTGDNGAGKTTFLSHLRSHPELIELNSRHSSIAMLDQMYEPLLYPYHRVWWNIALPKMVSNELSMADAKSLARQRLEHLELDVDLERYPTDLSGGEKHLVLLARMTLASHEILLLDEPATGVDASRLDKVWTIVRDLTLNRGKHMIIATHREFPPADAGRMVTFDGVGGKQLVVTEYQFRGEGVS